MVDISIIGAGANWSTFQDVRRTLSKEAFLTIVKTIESVE